MDENDDSSPPKNLTIIGALHLSKSLRGPARAASLRIFANLLRNGVHMPPEAVEFIAQSLETHADTMPKSSPAGGRPKSASKFFGLVAQVIMQERNATENEAVQLLLEFLSEHDIEAPDESTIRKQRRMLDGTLIASPKDMPGIRRVLEWAETR